MLRDNPPVGGSQEWRGQAPGDDWRVLLVAGVPWQGEEIY